MKIILEDRQQYILDYQRESKRMRYD